MAKENLSTKPKAPTNSHMCERTFLHMNVVCGGRGNLARASGLGFRRTGYFVLVVGFAFSSLGPGHRKADSSQLCPDPTGPVIMLEMSGNTSMLAESIGPSFSVIGVNCRFEKVKSNAKCHMSDVA